MNVYDSAHGLAQAIKASEEFKQFSELQKIIDLNPEVSGKIKEMQMKQMELQGRQMAGEDVKAEVLKSAQDMAMLVQSDPTAGRYIQAEMRFALMMQDVYKIIGDAIDVGNMPNV